MRRARRSRRVTQSAAQTAAGELDNLIAHIEQGGHPACFNAEEEYHQWRALAAFTNLPSLAICRDCLPGYQREMAAAGRCHFAWAHFTARAEGVVGNVAGLSVHTLWRKEPV